MKLLNAIAASTLMLLFSTPAEARHHRHYHHHRSHGVSPTDPVAMTSDGVSPSGDHPLVRHAAAYLGAGNVTGFRGPWCGAFMAKIAREVGHALPRGPNLAANWASLPRTSAHVGAIAVFRHHVAIVAGFRGGTPLLLGGNQAHHRVSIHPMRRGAIAFVE
jgi:hypothetical protein